MHSPLPLVSPASLDSFAVEAVVKVVVEVVVEVVMVVVVQAVAVVVILMLSKTS